MAIIKAFFTILILLCSSLSLAVDSKSYFVTSTSDVRIHVYETGDLNNPTILFLHGFPDELNLWSKQIDLLKDDYHIIAMDMRGMGKSTQPHFNATYKYTLDRLITDVDAVVNKVIPNKRFNIVAHDWGGGVGWHYIDNSPNKGRVDNYIPIASPDFAQIFRFIARHAPHCNAVYCSEEGKIALGQMSSSAYIAFFMTPLASEAFFWSGAYIGNVSNKDYFEKALQLNGLPEDDPYVKNRHRDEIYRSSENGLKYYRANMLNPSNNFPEKYSRTARVHLIWGEEDSFFVPGTQKYIHEYFIKDCLFTEEVIPDGKHWVMRQFPVKITHSIRQVMSQPACTAP